MKDKMKNVTLICPSFRFSKIEFFKPTFYFMKYLKECYDINSTIVYDETLNEVFYYGDSKIDKKSFSGVNFLNVQRDDKNIKRKIISLYRNYLKENSKDISLLLVFHGDKNEIKLCNYYKKLNPNGKIMNIMDFSIESYNIWKNSFFGKLKHFVKSFIYKFSYRKFCKNCDIFTVETKKCYDYLLKNKWNGNNISKKLELLPFGVDKKDFGLKENEKFKKENIFISVGRIGTEQKNFEMILNTLKKVNLKDWKYIFIGPIEESFKEKIDEFFKTCPKMKNNVIFAGSVTDRKILADYYRKSKVFVLSSKYESFALVLIEALTFQNFILSTPVGCAEDIIKNGTGYIVENEDSLLIEMQLIIDNKVKINTETCKEVAKNYNYENLVSNFKFFKDNLE